MIRRADFVREFDPGEFEGDLLSPSDLLIVHVQIGERHVRITFVWNEIRSKLSAFSEHLRRRLPPEFADVAIAAWRDLRSLQ